MNTQSVAASPRPRKWTDEALRLEAQKYTTKREFIRGSNIAYQTIRKSGRLEEFCSHMQDAYHRWSDDELIAEARKYTTRGEFQEKASSAYQIVIARGLQEIACAHMKYVRNQWTDELLHEEALKYGSRTEFARKAGSAYNTALRRGLLDTICSHMEKTRLDCDTIYLWRVKNTDIYKIGVTSVMYGLCRMYQVAEAGGFDPELLVQTTTNRRPYDVEKELLSLGRPVVFDQKFHGYTEFRRLSDPEVKQAVGIIASNSWLN